MSEPKLISPMLDNFVMGAPYSDHHGVRCCPAMVKDSDSRYIVKVISVPASQVQLDALLLTGACKNDEDALNYFQGLANEVVSETEVLKKLSAMEGFLPYEACQVVPMEDQIGFDIYLLSPYRKSLERHFRKYPMTHLAAANLGLDMCAALAVCRQAGYLYADLQPGNIFISEDQEYRIGDLGFLKLDSLKYASIPDKYRSAYTAPEVSDATSSINQTIDIYAAGLVLYQAYNGGVLPFEDHAPAEELPAPMYADYEIAEIILKACAPKPEDRWQDPIEMGQAIVSYMQRNGVNDTPIVPPIVVDPVPTEEEQEVSVPEETPEKDANEDVLSDQVCIAECFDNGEDEELSQLNALIGDSADPEGDEDIANLSFMDRMTSDDTAPDEHAVAGVAYGELSSDVNDMLVQADDLLAHETPEGVVAPDLIDVPVPAPIVRKSPKKQPVSVQATQVVPVAEDVFEEEYPDDEDYPQEEEEYRPVDKKVGGKILTGLLVLLLIACLGIGLYLFYNEYYLQSVTELRLDGSEDSLTVFVTSEADPARLSVVCTDTHGGSKTSSVIDGCAQFTGLNPNTLYTVKVEISGFGKLTGETSDSYTTPVQTNITSFTALTGEESGSVRLEFAVEGKDVDSCTVTYQAKGEDAVSQTFNGHRTTIRGLTVGKTYTFTLGSETDLYITGSDTLDYTAVDPVYAEDLKVVSCTDDSIVIKWNAPEGSNVTQWTVKCYNGNGYDQTIYTDETTATFTGISSADAHTVEVTANGMSAATPCYISANAVTLSNIKVSQTGDNTLKLSWDAGEAKPEGKWLIIYTVDGSTQQEILRSDSSTVNISPIVPDSQYSFTIQLEDNTTVLGGETTFRTNQAPEFSGYMLSTSRILVSMCKAPAASGWDHSNVPDTDYTTTFASGQLVGLVLMSTHQYNMSSDPITTMYLIRDENGVPVSWNSTTQTWTSMWWKNYCELTVPAMPTTAGKYTIDIYLNGQALFNQTFTITE